LSQAYGIHWFRRDLRVAGNGALRENWRRHQGRVVGLFTFDKDFLGRPDFSVNRFQFFMETLKSLHQELNEIGSDLLFMDIGPHEAFKQLMTQLKTKPQTISWSQDYEPYSRQRDEQIQKFLKTHSIESLVERDHLLIEPHELSKKGSPGEHYQVYSPFARQWLQLFQDDEIQARIKVQKKGLAYLSQRLKGKVEKNFDLKWKQIWPQAPSMDKVFQTYLEGNGKRVDVPIPVAGSLEGYKKMSDFKHRLDHYSEDRDFPALSGTSKFSLFFKNGSLTVPQVISYFDLQPYKKKKTARDSFFSELIWREFYYHILFHNPDVEKQSFLSTYRDIPWENNQQWFELWKQGRTGFPIVDAGMRQLKTTGWMHNRVRMIVASFLTKDLLIDWRWGEKYFMETLLDGDLAPNNGGWQWAASTGCDPQPYFRIFNPWLQGKKFDGSGEYIKTYLPELKDLPAKQLHQPIIGHPSYPEPIVEHSEQREKALAMYKLQREGN
jgi:deoxyribodipyrimidine photo-lyase